MIAFISGNVQTKTDSFLIISCSGVGYLVFVTTDTIQSIKENQAIELYVYTVVREQELALYGFPSLPERQFFELLLSVSGIGPKSALEFLNVPIDAIKNAISTKDTAFLSKVKGIGKKTAERLIIELKNKLGAIEVLDMKIVNSDQNSTNQDSTQDVVLALESLGYDRLQVVQKLKTAPQFSSTEEAIRWFLQGK
jgi:holliday junction DNA helicase RuvA